MVTPMNNDDLRVPTLLLCAGGQDERDTAVARLVEPAAAGRPIAVLRAGAGPLSSPDAPMGPHVVVRRAPIGCLCCTARVGFRVALFGLLHSTRPARLVVDLGPGDHVATLEAELRGESLARVLRLVGRVDLNAFLGLRALAWPVDLQPP